MTVTDRGWDTHQDLEPRLKEGYTGGTVGKVPTLDLAWSALISDLDERGLLDETLVIVMGEFGRTPKLNTSAAATIGRGSSACCWPAAACAAGKWSAPATRRGESPAERPVTPADLAATIYTLLGIDPAASSTRRMAGRCG